MVFICISILNDSLELEKTENKFKIRKKFEFFYRQKFPPNHFVHSSLAFHFHQVLKCCKDVSIVMYQSWCINRDVSIVINNVLNINRVNHFDYFWTNSNLNRWRPALIIWNVIFPDFLLSDILTFQLLFDWKYSHFLIPFFDSRKKLPYSRVSKSKLASFLRNCVIIMRSKNINKTEKAFILSMHSLFKTIFNSFGVVGVPHFLISVYFFIVYCFSY